MSPPEKAPPSLWPPLLLAAGVLLASAQLRHPTLALAALATLVLVPTAWRLMGRRWVRGDVIRGLGAGFLASHVPVLVGALATLQRPECRIRLCLEGVVAGARYVPWAGVLGMLLYWAWAPPVPPRQDERG
jgi:hypothetical protein